jgi:hypothetical protein
MRSARRLPALLLVTGLVLAGCSSSDDGEPEAGATTSTTTAAEAGEGTAAEPLARYADYETVSYDDPDRWVCRPDRDDLCDGDLDVTVVEADGTLTVEPFERAQDPPIDCFYVYPTISQDQTAFSDWDWSPDEEGYVVLSQAAHLQSQCRLFAPVYRQRTLAGLASRFTGSDDGGEEEGDPYADVLDAFKTYMANDNGGRGIVLVGHSQGTGMLNQLIRDEVDPHDDVRALLVGAYLAGGAVAVPSGELLGGDLATVPLCAEDGEVGCVSTWAAFRATAPPPPNSLFGRPRGGDGEAGCVSPSSFAGDVAELDAIFPARGGASILGSAGDDPDARRWLPSEAGEVTTPWVRVPGLLQGACAGSNGFRYLAVEVLPSDGPRVDDVPGDLSPEWGLHLIDVNLVMGDVVRQVDAQAAAWLAARGD